MGLNGWTSPQLLRRYGTSAGGSINSASRTRTLP